MNVARCTILIVDDDFSSLEVLSLLFEREGFSVLIASDGEEALELARTTTPDVIVTDYMMPKMDGLELCSELGALERTKHVPVVLMSASFAGQLPPGPIVGFVRKPFLFDRLLGKVRHACEGRRSKPPPESGAG